MNPVDVGGVVLPAWCLWLIGTAAVVAAGSTIYRKALVPLFRVGKAVHRTLERVEGYGPRLEAVERNTRQLTPNGGSHLADAVNRIEAEQRAMREEQQALREDFQTEILRLWQTIAAKDVVQAAAKTGEHIAAAGKGKVSNG